MSSKRSRAALVAEAYDSDEEPDQHLQQQPHPPKRPRRTSPAAVATAPFAARDHMSTLSDELLLRILSFLDLAHLLHTSLASRRLGRLSSDSQLWKALYYARFVLPRAMRIPGYRRDDKAGEATANHRLHYSGRRALWADGRRGGLVRSNNATKTPKNGGVKPPLFVPGQLRREGAEDDDADSHEHTTVDWKRQYRTRHNWSRGKCAVEELRLGDSGRRKMLVKVVDGIAVTADGASGLRVWDLRTKEMLARAPLCTTTDEAGSLPEDEGSSSTNTPSAVPTCIAVDEQYMDRKTLYVAVGFLDGSFGVWKWSNGKDSRELVRRYRHESSSNGELIGMAYSHPYLVTATGGVLISLYNFDGPAIAEPDSPQQKEWPPPIILNSLKSHSADPPLALSLRKAGATTIASIAYTFHTRQGWSIGIQDLHVKPSASSSAHRLNQGTKPIPDVISTRLAYTTPMAISNSRRSALRTPQRRMPVRPPLESSSSSSGAGTRRNLAAAQSDLSDSSSSSSSEEDNTSTTDGPTTLCYTHPYLLATLPDNTLVLHLCTSSADSLTISPGIRLWGHTSGISDAEITSRGRAVSVSTRGDEMRVWELEGGRGGSRSRSTAAGSSSSRSVEIRANHSPVKIPDGTTPVSETQDPGASSSSAWEDRRDWVGFDDEMVIVLKERAGSGDSLMVYDFT